MTVIVIISTLLVLISYDVWTACHNGLDTTISDVIRKYSQQYPVIPFAAGILCGHFFWFT